MHVVHERPGLSGGADPNQVMAAVFDQTLAALTLQFGASDPTLWILPRGTIDFSHPFLPVDVLLNGGRATLSY